MTRAPLPVSTWGPGRGEAQTPLAQPIRGQHCVRLTNQRAGWQWLSRLRVTHINGPGPQEPSSRSGYITQGEGAPPLLSSLHILQVIPPLGQLSFRFKWERFGDFNSWRWNLALVLKSFKSGQTTSEVRSYCQLVGYQNRSEAYIPIFDQYSKSWISVRLLIVMTNKKMIFVWLIK